MRGGQGSGTRFPSGPAQSRTPPAGQGRRRRGRPGPLPELRARPRKQGGAAARPSPRRRRPHGAEQAARRCHPGPPAGRPRCCSRRLWGGSLELGPLGAPGGPRAALTVGGLQGAKKLASGAPGAVTASFPSPLLWRQRRQLQWRRRQQLPRLRNRRRRWRRLHFRSGHHFRFGSSPAPEPSPHWVSRARGCPGRPRGARTEGGGRRAKGRDAAAGGEGGGRGRELGGGGCRGTEMGAGS